MITEADHVLDQYFHGEAPAVEQLTHDERLDLLTAMERMRHWLDATSARTLAVMADNPEPLPITKCRAKPGEFLRDEVACAVGWSFGVAHDRITAAQTLVHKLPITLTAVENGEVSYLKAQHLAKAVGECDPQVAAEIEARVLPRAGSQNLPAFQKSVSRAVLALDPSDRHEKARADRAVSARNLDDGMALIQALVPAVDKATIMTAINAIADAYPHDDRTADQRRADALTDICAAVLAGDLSGLRCGTRQGRPVTVELTVPLSAILGHDGQPAELAGYGAVPAAVARALAFDDQARWRTLVTTDAGYLLDYGRTVYEPPQALRDYVIARDRTCSVPNCQRRARESDIDHLLAAEDGGATSALNCHPLCPHHHKMKHEAGWAVTRLDDGSFRWTAPTGRTYLKYATALPL